MYLILKKKQVFVILVEYQLNLKANRHYAHPEAIAAYMVLFIRNFIAKCDICSETEL
jgi:hypothetical protein